MGLHWLTVSFRSAGLPEDDVTSAWLDAGTDSAFLLCLDVKAPDPKHSIQFCQAKNSDSVVTLAGSFGADFLQDAAVRQTAMSLRSSSTAREELGFRGC